MELREVPRPTTNAGWYALPFELVKGAVAAIVPSAKLRSEAIDQNRYYIDLSSLGLDKAPERMNQIADALLLPQAARETLQTAFSKFGHLRFIGVGPSRGKIAYRLYLGWGPETHEAEHMATAIDWHPGEDAFFTKTYGNLGRLPHREEIAHVNQCLHMAETDAPEFEIRSAVAGAVGQILAKARGDLGTNTAREPDSPRKSVSFNYNFVAYTENADIAPQLAALTQSFGIPVQDMARWRAASDRLRLLDIAVGTGADGLPFVTLYHGLLREPPAYIDVPQDRFDAAQRRGAPALTKPLTGAVPATTSVGGLAYVLGTLAVEMPADFPGNRLGRAQHVQQRDHAQLAETLAAAPDLAERLTWIMQIRNQPAYIIAPAGAFAAELYAYLRKMLVLTSEQDTGPQLIAVPGRLSGHRRVGHRDIPVIAPQKHGFGLVPSYTTLSERCADLTGVTHPTLAALAGWSAANAPLAGVTATDRAINAALVLDAQTGLFVRGALPAFSAPVQIVARPAQGLGPVSSDLIEVDLTYADAPARMQHTARAQIDVSSPLPTLVHGPNYWRHPR